MIRRRDRAGARALRDHIGAGRAGVALVRIGLDDVVEASAHRRVLFRADGRAARIRIRRRELCHHDPDR